MTLAPPLYRGEAGVLLVAVSLVWAISAFLVEYALTAVPPATISLVRLGLAALVLGALCGRDVFRPLGSKTPWNWRYGAVALFGQALPFVLIAWAQIHVAPATASVLVATTPIFATALAWGYGDIRGNVGVWFGIVLGLGGLVGFFGTEVLAVADGVWPRYVALILSAILFASAGRLVGRLPHPSALVRGAIVTRYSAAILLAGSFLIDRLWELPAPPAGVIVALIFAGVISSAFAYAAYYRLIAVGGLPLATTHHYITPVCAVLIQIGLTSRLPTIEQFAFMTAIVVGVALVSTWTLRPNIHRRAIPSPQQTR